MNILGNQKKYEKNMFFSFKNQFCFDKQYDYNAALLVLPFKEVTLQPELSSAPCFIIQGGGSLTVTDGNPRF